MTQARINDVLNVANEVQETEKQLVAVSSLRWAECEVAGTRTGLPWDQAELGGAGGRGLTIVLQKVPSEDDPKLRNHGEGPYYRLQPQRSYGTGGLVSIVSY